MKFLLTFFLVLSTITVFGQGTAIRAVSGFGTNTTFYGTGGGLSLQTTTRLMYDVGGVAPSLDWGLRRLKDGGGLITSYDWDARIQYDVTGVQALDHANRLLKNALGVTYLDWSVGTLSSTVVAALPLLTNAITATFDGGGAIIATNIVRYVTIPYNCTVIGFTMLSDTSTLTVVDVWRTTYALYDAGSTHPVVADSITAALPPTIGFSLLKTNVASVGTWSASLTNGNILAFKTITNSAATTLSLMLQVTHAP